LQNKGHIKIRVLQHLRLHFTQVCDRWVELGPRVSIVSWVGLQACTGAGTRVAPEFGSGQNPAFFPNPAPVKIPPEPDAIAGC